VVGACGRMGCSVRVVTLLGGEVGVSLLLLLLLDLDEDDKGRIRIPIRILAI